MDFDFIIMLNGDMFHVPTIVPSTIISLKYYTFNSSWNIEKLDSFVFFSSMKGCHDSVKSSVSQKSSDAKIFISLHKKWSFPLRISSVNVTKSAVFLGFCHIYRRNPWWKTSFLCSVSAHFIYSRNQALLSSWLEKVSVWQYKGNAD